MIRDVVVIGAGLAGSGAAAALAQRGWDVLLVERDSLPRHKVCGEFLSPESQSSLAGLGVLPTVTALCPVPLHHARLVAASGRALNIALSACAWGVPRYTLDSALFNAARDAGADARTGVAATAVSLQDGGGWVDLRTGPDVERVHARVIMVACGRHPARPLRARPGTDPAQSAVGVKCHLVGARADDAVELYVFDGGYVGIAPVADGRVNMCLLASRAAFRRAGANAQALITAAMQWNPALGARLAHASVVSDTLCTVAPVDTNDRPAPWHGAPRLGDAAAMIPPLCGDGMSMALRSAELCVPLAHAVLSHAMTPHAWEHAYRRAWTREFGPRLYTARALERALLSPRVASWSVGIGHAFPALATRLFHATRG